MKLRIARKICRYMGYGYPIDNTQRLERAVRTWEKAQWRIKHFMRDIKMSVTKPKLRRNNYGTQRLHNRTTPCRAKAQE